MSLEHGRAARIGAGARFGSCASTCELPSWSARAHGQHDVVHADLNSRARRADAWVGPGQGRVVPLCRAHSTPVAKSGYERSLIWLHTHPRNRHFMRFLGGAEGEGFEPPRDLTAPCDFRDRRSCGLTPIRAAGVGFEPTGDLSAASGFQDRPVRPLRHPAWGEASGRRPWARRISAAPRAPRRRSSPGRRAGRGR
jgi:hypothetical protein